MNLNDAMYPISTSLTNGASLLCSTAYRFRMILSIDSLHFGLVSQPDRPVAGWNIDQHDKYFSSLASLMHRCKTFLMFLYISYLVCWLLELAAQHLLC